MSLKNLCELLEKLLKVAESGRCGYLYPFVEIKDDIEGEGGEMKRPDSDYTYLEWITGLRMSVNTTCDLEIMRISHDDDDERPWEFIKKIQSYVEHYKKQIPDDL